MGRFGSQIRRLCHPQLLIQLLTRADVQFHAALPLVCPATSTRSISTVVLDAIEGIYLYMMDHCKCD
ncbi:hypothetical protein VTN02DRAFT_3656 [Thermoascus thermophilus]